MPDSDIARAREVDLAQLIGRSVKLKKAGREFTGLCPFHNEKTPSFTVVPEKGFFHCHGCGAHGDSIEWVRRLENRPFADAVAHLLNGALGHDPLPPRVAQTSARSPPKTGMQSYTFPAPREPTPDELSHPTHGPPAKVFRVNNAAGELLHLVCRWEPKPKALPLVYGECAYKSGSSKTGWHWHHAPTPRPLYGLDRLAAKPDAVVIVCEGEKKADAVATLFPTMVGVSWTGGASSGGKADWEPLRGRTVALWPDNDEPGRKARDELTPLLYGRAAQLMIVDPAGQPDSWDIADALRDGWTPEQAMAWAQAHLRPFAPDAPEQQPAPPPIGGDAGPPPVQYDWRRAEPANAPVPLGYDKTRYFYLQRATGIVRAMTAQEHTKRGIMQLAPLDTYWGREDSPFVTDLRGKRVMDVDAAANWLMRECERTRFYDPTRIRGRGVWLDEGRWIVHLGDRLIVDGVERQLYELDSHFIYEVGLPIQARIGKPLSDDEAQAYVELCRRLDFAQPWHADAIAGWVAASLITGAMPWRPHLFMDGPPGSGKGSVLKRFMRPAMGGLHIAVALTTTAVAVRNMLAGDALAVFFDEAEGEAQKDRERVQEVINLARASSDEEGAEIGMGGSGGKVDRYHLRSPFCLAATNNPVTQSADRTRFLIVVKTKPANPDDWPEMSAAASALLTPEYAAGMLSRMLQLIPTVRANAQTFIDVVGGAVGSRRAGETMGVPLAGLYALQSQALLSADEAFAFANDRGWIARAGAIVQAQDADHQRALATLMEAKLRVPHGHGSVDASVAGLAEIVQSGLPKDGILADTAQDTLKLHGMMVWQNRFWLCTDHEFVKQCFARTPFAISYRTILARTPGLEDGRLRFQGPKRPAIGVPIELAIGEA